MEYKRLADKKSSTVFAALSVPEVYISTGCRLWCANDNIVILLD